MFKSNNFLTILAILSLFFLGVVLIVAIIQYTKPLPNQIISLNPPASTPVSVPVSNPVK